MATLKQADHAASRRTAPLLNAEQLAEEHVNHVSALSEDDTETRSGASRHSLQDHSITGDLQFIKARKWILQRLRKGFACFDGVQGLAQGTPRIRRLLPDEFQGLVIQRNPSLHPGL